MRRYASLQGRREFALVLRRGRTASTKALSVSAIDAKTAGKPRIGIVTTAKVGNAVVRNLLRRRCKAIMDEAGVPDRTWLVVLVRPSAATMSFHQLRQELTTLLARSSTGAGNSRGRREPQIR